MKGKIIVPLVLASVSSTMLATQNFSVKANYTNETNLIGDTIEVSKISKKEYKVGGDPIIIPQVANTKVVVLDPKGQPLSGVTTSFKPTEKGYYTIKYQSTSEKKLTTAIDDIKIFVEDDEYEIKLQQNSQHFLPAVINVDANAVVKVPLPQVFKGETEVKGEELTNGLKVKLVKKDIELSSTNPKTLEYNPTSKTYNFSVDKAGIYEVLYEFYDNRAKRRDYKTEPFVARDNFKTDNMELYMKLQESKPTTATLGVKCDLPEVKVYDKNGTSDPLNAFVDIKVSYRAGNGQYENVEVKDYSFVPMKKGEYVVTYKASIPLYNKETKEFSFIISDVRDTERPDVAVVNGYTTITENGKTYVKTVTNSKGVVLYERTGQTGVTEEKKQELVEKALDFVSYDIPSVVALKEVNGKNEATVKFPAIYGVDNFSELGKLKFKRTIVKTSNNNIYELVKTTADGKTEPYKSGEIAEYKFTEAGEYTIKYEVIDEVGNSKIIPFDIKVVGSENELKVDNALAKPEINFPAMVSAVEYDSKLKFERPSVTDKFDTRVETKVYYSFTDPNTNNYSENEITETNKDGKFILDLAKLTEAASNDKIYIIAEAKNDYNTEVSKTIKTVKIIKTNADASIPKLTTQDNVIFKNLAKVNKQLINKNLGSEKVDDNGLISGENAINNNGFVNSRAPFNQKDEIVLPEMVFTDNDEYLLVDVNIMNPFGKNTPVKNFKCVPKKETEGYSFTVKDVKFDASYSGIYTVRYTAKDSSGNMCAKSFGIRIYDVDPPKIQLSNYNPLPDKIEIGKFIEVSPATIIDNGITLNDVTTDVPFENKIDGKAGTYWEIDSKSVKAVKKGSLGFIAKEKGDILINYYGWDENGNVSQTSTFTVHASDTIKPTIKLETGFYFNKTPSWGKDTTSVEVKLPGVETKYDGVRDNEDDSNNFDQTDVEDIDLTVKVTDVDGKEVTTSVVTEDGINRYKFTAEKQGKYTVTYTAIDAFGNSSVITEEVQVGDCKEPVIEWVNEKQDLIHSANINDYYEFNIDKINIDGIKGSQAIKLPEGSATTDKADYTIVVQMYNPSSGAVTNEITNNKNAYKWKFTESGKYELRIIVTDKAGNKTTSNYDINVANKEAKTQKVKPIVGTVLIVISSLILVGVIAYFVITSVKKSNKKGSKNNRKRK